VVEDFAEGVEEDLPYSTVVAATFALIYADRQVEIIPDALPAPGFADDSAVVAPFSSPTKTCWPPTPAGTR